MKATFFVLCAIWVSFVLAVEGSLEPDCGTSFFLCKPQGADSNTLGSPGKNWKDLYSSILDTINNAPVEVGSSSNDTSGPAKRENAFCCAESSECMLLQHYEIPMCWDRFTTDIFFPDGTYGSVVKGNLTTNTGDKIDLVYGTYVLKNGMIGSIYENNGEDMPPNMSTLELPTPWTSSGIGTAIPATELGTNAEISTVTTVVPETTEAPFTFPSLTITMIATMSGCGHCAGSNTTIPGPTVPGITRLESTNIFTTVVSVPPFRGLASHLRIPGIALISMLTLILCADIT